MINLPVRADRTDIVPTDENPPTAPPPTLLNGIRFLLVLKIVLQVWSFWTNGPQSYWGWLDLVAAIETYTGHALRADPLVRDFFWLLFVAISQLIEWVVISNLKWFTDSWRNVAVGFLLTLPLSFVVALDVADSAAGFYSILIPVSFGDFNLWWGYISLGESLLGDIGTLVAILVINHIVTAQYAEIDTAEEAEPT